MHSNCDKYSWIYFRDQILVILTFVCYMVYKIKKTIIARQGYIRSGNNFFMFIICFLMLYLYHWARFIYNDYFCFCISLDFGLNIFQSNLQIIWELIILLYMYCLTDISHHRPIDSKFQHTIFATVNYKFPNLSGQTRIYNDQLP